MVSGVPLMQCTHCAGGEVVRRVVLAEPDGTTIQHAGLCALCFAEAEHCIEAVMERAEGMETMKQRKQMEEEA